MDQLDFEVKIGSVRTNHAMVMVSINVDGGRGQVMLYVAPTGRGSGGLAMLGAQDYAALKELFMKVDTVIAGAATNGTPLRLKP